MLIDCILDRYAGEPYSPRQFYLRALDYDQDDVSRALDGGSNADIRSALCEYIDCEEYNTNIKAFIRAADWLTSDGGREWRKIVKI